jgi:uncharacterized protein YtpQ (UPF0354 family)
MSEIPREPEAFTESVAKAFRRLIDKVHVKITGPMEIAVEGRRVDLEDLHRATLHGQEAADELVQRFVDAYLGTVRLEQTPLPFELARGHVLPRIQPLRFFKGRRPDLLATQAFVNDTVILYVIDLNNSLTPVTLEQLIRWGVSVEELDETARMNLAEHEPDLEVKVFHGDDGAAAVFNTGDGYDASRLLLGHLHEKLAPELGREFLVAIPTRDVFIAFPLQPADFADRLHKRVRVDYKKLPYPITDDLFLVARDGVAGFQSAA